MSLFFLIKDIDYFKKIWQYKAELKNEGDQQSGFRPVVAKLCIIETDKIKGVKRKGDYRNGRYEINKQTKC